MPAKRPWQAPLVILPEHFGSARQPWRGPGLFVGAMADARSHVTPNPASDGITSGYAVS